MVYKKTMSYEIIVIMRVKEKSFSNVDRYLICVMNEESNTNSKTQFGVLKSFNRCLIAYVIYPFPWV